MLKKVSFSGDNLSLLRIADYYDDSEKALRFFFSPNNPEYNSRFNGYTRDEIEEELRLRLEELDKSVSFSILSALEALFRVDYLTRCYSKKKDPLSRKMRNIYQIHQIKKSHVSLEKDILILWKEEYPQYKSLISKIITAFKYRHWLAHGPVSYTHLTLPTKA